MIIGLLFCGLSYSQIDTSYVVGDTLIKMTYYKNGQLEHLSKYLKGRDMHSYNYSYWYYKNGNPKWLNYWDNFLDTSYYISKRKNGTVKFRDITNKDYFERIEQNTKGQLTVRTISYFKDTFSTEEKYKKGQIISTKREVKNQVQTSSKIDTVKYYQGQVGGSSMVVEMENNGIKEFTVNGTKISEAEYLVYKDKYEFYIKRRTPKHFYQEYSADSILDYEGIFKGVDLPCGVYREYYPNGVIKVRGQYNNKGEKNMWWTYYNEQGLINNKELFEDGLLKQ